MLSFDISWFIDWTLSLTHALLIFLVLRAFVPVRFENRIVTFLELFGISLIGNVIIYPEEVTGTIGSLLGLLFILFFFHKSKWYMKITAAFIVYPVMTAISFFFQDLGQFIWMYIFQKNLSSTGQTVLYLIMRALRVPAWYFIYRYVKTWIPQAISTMTIKMWLMLDLISVTSFAGIITVIYKCTSYDSYLAWPACAAVLITSMGCCYLCTYMAKIVRMDLELQTMQYQQSYYKEIESNQQTVRRMRHDMKNHLNIIGTLLKDQQYEETKRYLHSLNQEFTTQTKDYCPNRIVNALLNAKMQQAEDAEILCNLQIDFLEAPPLTDLELCSLFSNTLDNAIEACIKISDPSKRKITLKARCINGYFSYEIVNAKVNKITEKNGHLETDKNDPMSHGIGLKTVRQIIKKYNGEIAITYNEETFQIIAFL